MTSRIEEQLEQALTTEPELRPIDGADWVADIETAGRKRRRSRRAIVVVATGVVALAALVPGIALSTNGPGPGSRRATAGSNSEPSTPSIMSEGDVKTHALSFAAGNGDPTPDSLSYVVTTRNAAMKQLDAPTPLENGVASADTPAILVVMTGKFVGYAASLPLGAAAPTGTEMDLLYNATTGEGIGWQVGDQKIDISALGPVITVAVK